MTSSAVATYTASGEVVAAVVVGTSVRTAAVAPAAARCVAEVKVGGADGTMTDSSCC